MKKNNDVGLRKFKQREQEALRAKEVLEYKWDDTSKQAGYIDLQKLFK